MLIRLTCLATGILIMGGYVYSFVIMPIFMIMWAYYSLTYPLRRVVPYTGLFFLAFLVAHKDFFV
jgi:hypothetical protein